MGAPLGRRLHRRALLFEDFEGLPKLLVIRTAKLLTRGALCLATFFGVLNDVWRHSAVGDGFPIRGVVLGDGSNKAEPSPTGINF